jgi:hypothetical protein
MLSGARRVVVKNEDVLYIGYGNGRDQGAWAIALIKFIGNSCNWHVVKCFYISNPM